MCFVSIVNIFYYLCSMNEKNRISVVINTRNAEQHLQQVLDCVRGFDEVLVCDMESTDSTVDIARKNVSCVISIASSRLPVSVIA